MKRRGFLGLIGGAAVAGPAVAKNALVTTAPLSGGSVLAGLNMAEDAWNGPEEVCATEYPSKLGRMIDWRIERMNELKRLLSGDKEEADHDIRPALRAAEMNISSLGSVSPSQKVRMLRTVVQNAKLAEKRRHWMSELLQLEGRP